MKKIIHISDLHFGMQDNKIAKILLTDINNYKPDLVVISGDLTQRAKSGQYEIASDFLAEIKCPYIAVPGNHDISLWNIFRRFFNPLKRFKKYITEQEFPTYTDENMIVVGVNSARSLTLISGRISNKQIEYLKNLFCKISEPIFKAIVIHHNLIPSDSIRSHKLMGRSSKFISQLKDCGINMIFSGHIHQYYSVDVNKHYKDADSIILAQAVTAISSRTSREKNSYNHIELNKDSITIKVMEYDEEKFAEERIHIYKRSTLFN